MKDDSQISRCMCECFYSDSRLKTNPCKQGIRQLDTQITPVISLFDVHGEVVLDCPLRNEGTALTGQCLPAEEYSGGIHLLQRDPSCLFNQLAEHLERDNGKVRWCGEKEEIQVERQRVEAGKRRGEGEEGKEKRKELKETKKPEDEKKRQGRKERKWEEKVDNCEGGKRSVQSRTEKQRGM